MSTEAMHDETGDEEFPLAIDWEMALPTLAVLFYLNDIRWDINGVLRTPSAAEIEEKALALIEGVKNLGGGVYLTLNNIKVYVDPEFPMSCEIYIKAGHASPRIPEDSK